MGYWGDLKNEHEGMAPPARSCARTHLTSSQAKGQEMINAALDHDGDTQPNHAKPQTPIDVLSVARLAELAELAQEQPGECMAVETETIAELVRLYSGVRHLADSLDHISRIGEALERQIDVAEKVAEGQLRRAGQNFQILLHWNIKQRLYTHVETGWHCTVGGIRWAGSFADALEIVRTEYGPTRGTSAFIVVRVADV